MNLARRLSNIEVLGGQDEKPNPIDVHDFLPVLQTRDVLLFTAGLDYERFLGSRFVEPSYSTQHRLEKIRIARSLTRDI